MNGNRTPRLGIAGLYAIAGRRDTLDILRGRLMPDGRLPPTALVVDMGRRHRTPQHGARTTWRIRPHKQR